MSLPGKDGRSCANFRIEFMKFPDPLNTERAPYFKGYVRKAGAISSVDDDELWAISKRHGQQLRGLLQSDPVEVDAADLQPAVQAPAAMNVTVTVAFDPNNQADPRHWINNPRAVPLPLPVSQPQPQLKSPPRGMLFGKSISMGRAVLRPASDDSDSDDDRAPYTSKHHPRKKTVPGPCRRQLPAIKTAPLCPIGRTRSGQQPTYMKPAWKTRGKSAGAK